MAAITKFDRVALTLLVILVAVTFVISQPKISAMVAGKVLDVAITVIVALGRGASAIQN